MTNVLSVTIAGTDLDASRPDPLKSHCRNNLPQVLANDVVVVRKCKYLENFQLRCKRLSCNFSSGRYTSLVPTNQPQGHIKSEFSRPRLYSTKSNSNNRKCVSLTYDRLKLSSPPSVNRLKVDKVLSVTIRDLAPLCCSGAMKMFLIPLSETEDDNVIENALASLFMSTCNFKKVKNVYVLQQLLEICDNSLGRETETISKKANLAKNTGLVPHKQNEINAMEQFKRDIKNAENISLIDPIMSFQIEQLLEFAQPRLANEIKENGITGGVQNALMRYVRFRDKSSSAQAFSASCANFVRLYSTTASSTKLFNSHIVCVAENKTPFAHLPLQVYGTTSRSFTRKLQQKASSKETRLFKSKYDLRLKSDKCKEDPCKEGQECPDTCKDELQKVDYNKKLDKAKVKKRKPMGCNIKGKDGDKPKKANSSNKVMSILSGIPRSDLHVLRISMKATYSKIANKSKCVFQESSFSSNSNMDDSSGKVESTNPDGGIDANLVESKTDYSTRTNSFNRNSVDWKGSNAGSEGKSQRSSSTGYGSENGSLFSGFDPLGDVNSSKRQWPARRRRASSAREEDRIRRNNSCARRRQDGSSLSIFDPCENDNPSRWQSSSLRLGRQSQTSDACRNADPCAIRSSNQWRASSARGEGRSPLESSPVDSSNDSSGYGNLRNNSSSSSDPCVSVSSSRRQLSSTRVEVKSPRSSLSARRSSNSCESNDPCASSSSGRNNGASGYRSQGSSSSSSCDPCAYGNSDRKQSTGARFEDRSRRSSSASRMSSDSCENNDPCASSGLSSGRSSSSSCYGSQDTISSSNRWQPSNSRGEGRSAGGNSSSHRRSNSCENDDSCASNRSSSDKRVGSSGYRNHGNSLSSCDPCAIDNSNRCQSASSRGEGRSSRSSPSARRSSNNYSDKRMGSSGYRNQNSSSSSGRQTSMTTSEGRNQLSSTSSGRRSGSCKNIDVCANGSQSSGKSSSPSGYRNQGSSSSSCCDPCGSDNSSGWQSTSVRSEGRSQHSGYSSRDGHDPCASSSSSSGRSNDSSGYMSQGNSSTSCCDPCAGGNSNSAGKSSTSYASKNKRSSSSSAKDNKSSKANAQSKSSSPLCKNNGNKKGGEKKPDPCKEEEKKLDAKCNKDPCADKSKDKKSKSADLCKKTDKKECQKDDKKSGKKADPCSKDNKKTDKKADTCSKDGGKGDKKADPCSKDKKGDKKSDPCSKNGGKGDKKADACSKDCGKGDKKADPCSKDKKGDKKADPCSKDDKKGDKKADACSKDCGKSDKKADTCSKDGGKGDKKADPCSKDKKGDKKADACSKDSGKGDKKADTCSKDSGKGDKKADPCSKDKKGDKKADSCSKDDKKGDKKADPCSKDGGKGDKKADPCSKDGGKGDKKADPCSKDGGKGDKKADPCSKDGGKGDKKADPCSKNNKKKDKRADSCSKNDKKDDKKADSCSKNGNKSDGKGDKKKGPCGVSQKESKPKCYSTFSAPSKPTRSFERLFTSKGASKDKNAKDQGKGKCNLIKEVKPAKRKPDPNARPKDKTKDDCYKDDADSCRKDDPNKPGCRRFSTYSAIGLRTSLDYAFKRSFVTYRISPKFSISNFGFSRRHKSGKGKRSNDDTKMVSELNAFQCKVQKLVKPRFRRPDPKARPKNRLTVCYTDFETQCPKKLCKDPAATDCKKYAKNRKGVGSKTKNSKVELYNSTIRRNNEIIKIEKACEIKKVCAAIPKFSAYDVLVRTGEVAITGSDIHVYEHGSTNSANISLGHDATGIIEATGECIHSLRKGDRVVMESSLSCGICEFCKRGVYNMCNNIIYNGFLMKYQVHPADLCYKLPDSVDMAEATLTQTLAQGCQAVFKAHITPTTNVLIMGSSAIAVASAFCAQAMGAKNVAFACTMPTPLASIHDDFDFDCVCYDVYGDYGEILEGIFCTFQDWPDVVINCAINERTMNIAVMCLRPCGTCVLTECESEGVCFNALDVLMKNVRIIPSFRSKNMFATAIHLINSGRAPMKKMIAARYRWSHIEQAFAAAQSESNYGYKKCHSFLDIL
uniref:Alcohol dehydrogenase-like N-terminal domain-containing protein n=1 Tax=Glossina austeni TaxID=7395 RepID=A0A1A9VBH2_GLOAU